MAEVKFLRSPLGQMYVEVQPGIIVRITTVYDKTNMERLIGRLEEIKAETVANYLGRGIITNSGKIGR